MRAIVKKIMDKDWSLVVFYVNTLMKSDLSGDQKRQECYKQLIEDGIPIVSWMIYIAIETAYGILKEQSDG